MNFTRCGSMSLLGRSQHHALLTHVPGRAMLPCMRVHRGFGGRASPGRHHQLLLLRMLVVWLWGVARLLVSPAGSSFDCCVDDELIIVKAGHEAGKWVGSTGATGGGCSHPTMEAGGNTQGSSTWGLRGGIWGCGATSQPMWREGDARDGWLPAATASCACLAIWALRPAQHPPAAQAAT